MDEYPERLFAYTQALDCTLNYISMNDINRLILLLLFFIGNTTGIHAADGEMPIIAYMGVPDWRTSDADFRTFAECGFNVSLYPYASLQLMVQACRYADKYGVKVLGKCPEMTSSPARAARTLKQERGFFGYFMQDEPGLPEISQRQQEIERLRSIDDTHTFYINLLPCYEQKPEWIYSVTKSRSYDDYLRAASATSCQQLSFDFYPILNDSIRSTWYHNLEMVRRESLASGKPFWGFVLSVPHSAYPQPTLESMRLQAYSNLAYGAQAIQFFTYWNPSKDEGYDYHDAPISREGKKTRTYGLVQKLNSELKSVGRLFYGAKVTAVGHLGVIAEGTTRQTTMPENLSSLKISSSKGAVISQFEKTGHRYLAIVNKDYKKKMKVYVDVRNNVPRHLTKDLREQSVKASYTVEAGDILLFMLK